MVYVKCPICDLNYINDEAQMCSVCAEKFTASKKIHREVTTRNPIILRGPVRYNGRAIFFVFQNQEFEKEFGHGYISAPYHAKGGSVPHHWQRLEYVRKGDIILHGVGGYIMAVSEAKGSYYDFTYPNGLIGRKIDCDYHILKRPLPTANYKKEIIQYCTGVDYQPFNKHGSGNQGYLFDIRRELAIIFIKELVKFNPTLHSELFIQEVI